MLAAAFGVAVGEAVTVTVAVESPSLSWLVAEVVGDDENVADDVTTMVLDGIGVVVAIGVVVVVEVIVEVVVVEVLVVVVDDNNTAASIIGSPRSTAEEIRKLVQSWQDFK
jgi:hypothetical protein